MISNLNSKNNINKDNNNKISLNGLTLSYKSELPANLCDRLVDYVKQQDKLNDFLKYDERQLILILLQVKGWRADPIGDYLCL
jgi:hypothetical protein